MSTSIRRLRIGLSFLIPTYRVSCFIGAALATIVFTTVPVSGATQSRPKGNASGAATKFVLVPNPVKNRYRVASRERHVTARAMKRTPLFGTPQRALGGTSTGPSLAAFDGQLYMAWSASGSSAGLIFWNRFDGVHWTSPQRAPHAATDPWHNSGPSLAVFHGRLYMAWKGAGQGIFWNRFDGAHWTDPQKVPNVGTSIGPSLAAFDGRLYMAWKGAAPSQGIFSNSFDGAHWTAQHRVPNVGTSFGPSLAAFHDRLYMAWKGVEGSHGIFWNRFDGAHWTAQHRVPNVGTSVGPSLAAFDGRLYMAWKGTGHNTQIWWNRFDIGHWTDQQRVDGAGTSGCPAAIQPCGRPSLEVSNSRLFMAWKGVGTDHSIWWASSR